MTSTHLAAIALPTLARGLMAALESDRRDPRPTGELHVKPREDVAACGHARYMLLWMHARPAAASVVEHRPALR